MTDQNSKAILICLLAGGVFQTTCNFVCLSMKGYKDSPVITTLPQEVLAQSIVLGFLVKKLEQHCCAHRQSQSARPVIAEAARAAVRSNFLADHTGVQMSRHF